MAEVGIALLRVLPGMHSEVMVVVAEENGLRVGEAVALVSCDIVAGRMSWGRVPK